MSTKNDVDNPIAYIHEHCRGRWDQILVAVMPALSEAVNNAPRHVPCPLTGTKEGFRFFRDFRDVGAGYVCTGKGFALGDGIEVLSFMMNDNKSAAINTLMQHLKGTRIAPVIPTKKWVEEQKKDRKNNRLRISRNLDRAFKSCAYSENHALPSMYYFMRGISLDMLPRDLLFSEQVKYWEAATDDTPEVSNILPAIMAIVRTPQGIPLTFHRTYLNVTGKKADVPNPKKLMEANETISGGAVQLFEPRTVLGLSEGIETALAVNSATGMPMWSTISAVGLENVVVPEHVTHVVIWADKDLSGTGQTSAIALQERLVDEGKQVLIRLPKRNLRKDEKGIDWLDVLNENGPDAFPHRRIKHSNHSEASSQTAVA